MKNPDYDPEKVTAVLKAVHGDKKVMDGDNLWSVRTMAAIRRVAAEKQELLAINGPAAFFQLVWRLSPVAAGLTGVLALCIMKFGFFPDTELLAVLYETAESQIYLF